MQRLVQVLRLLFLLPFLISALALHAGDSLVLIRSIPVKARLFSTDPVGNVFMVKEDNSLLRLNSRGDSTGFFNEVRRGQITHIDATNPLRILLFFGDYGEIVILDNILSKKSTLRLPAIGIFNVRCMANSADGNIWVYESASGTLLKINEEPSVVFSTPLRNFFNENPDPEFMAEQDRNLFMTDTIDGIRRFDQYAFYRNSYDFRPKEVQFVNQYLIYYAAPYLVSYHTGTLQEQRMLLPQPETIRQARIERDRIYVLRETSLDLYALPSR